MSNESVIISIMIKAVRKAGKGLIRDFGEVENLQVSKKGPGDFVSVADKKAEKIIHSDLSYARPDYGFLMEEAGEIKGKDENFRWIVDPLDGTMNFLHGLPHFCISIALEEKKHSGKREIIAGVTYLPITGEIYWAEKGCGAWLDSDNHISRLRMANRSKIGDALVSIGSMKQDYKLINSLVDSVGNSIRCVGSSAIALAYVASGKYDTFIQDDFCLWDVAAGALLVSEAGGYVASISGHSDFIKKGSILATNEALQPQFVKALK
ncbi:inositol monophosphatase [Rickettsiales bacterium]|nr:inositol monophosphatase [Rickettsiales bacterium]